MIAFFLHFSAAAETVIELREERDKLVEKGLWRDALTFYGEHLQPVSDEESGKDLAIAVSAIARLDGWAEFDEWIENVIAGHPENASVQMAAATAYRGAPHTGRLIGGDFERGLQGRFGRGRDASAQEPVASAGEMVVTEERDDVRALQLLRQALLNSKTDPESAGVWGEIAAQLRRKDVWKFQVLTSLEILPEWGETGPDGGTEGAPWKMDRPVVYEIPETWESAKNDGERWRFALAEKARLDPSTAAAVVLERARFSQSQFGTETMASFGWWREVDPDTAKGLLEMDTLEEDECLAKTSDGVRRFKLPADQHFIALYRSVFDDAGVGAAAADALVDVFLNRRQFDKARLVLEQRIEKFGAGPQDSRKVLLDQIIGNWGRFGVAETVPASTRPKLPLVFRNAKSIRLKAAPVDMEALLRDTTAYLKGNPRIISWDRINPSSIATRLIREKNSKYLADPIANWEQPLTPEELHRDTRTDLEIPLEKPGAWWITGEMEGGASFHTLIWIVDTVIAQRDVGGQKQWWVADAKTGAPIEAADVEFFGYNTRQFEPKGILDRKIETVTESFTKTTDGDGKVLLKPGDWKEDYQWMAIARKEGRASAFFGFTHLGVDEAGLENGNRDISYAITDRPLYKPGDTVHAKFFLRNVGYFEPDIHKYARKGGTLKLFNARGEEAVSVANLVTDELGAIEAEAILPKDAPLGEWRAVFEIPNVIEASATFRMEEYRKPEYEVTVDAPAEPVRLGGKFTATVKANYFHGAPVRNATVEVIVTRTSLGERWFPAGPWDWLYGRGSWWPGVDATWHPQWKTWGCMPPPPPWWGGGRWTPDEFVFKKEMRIGDDGTVEVEVDTASAREIHGDLDARYIIEARVVDASRREERGTGEVIAARKPFEVVTWANRGFARAGDEIEANVSAATLAGKPVVGAKGTLRLMKLSSGENGAIDETEVSSWPIETDAEGKVLHRFAAPETGQFRLAAALAFQDGEPVEGATILNIQGPGRSEAGDWKFGNLELLTDKASYGPDETLRLRVNSDHVDAHVWLFLHIGGSSGREARRIQLDGKSLEVEVPLDRRDMPNMFIEAVTIRDAKMYQAVRQVLLPPENKLIEVTLEPEKTKVKPREESALLLTLRDTEGKPVTGSAAITIYDKALEAITGGSNVPPIRGNFWSWKNFYYEHRSGFSIPAASGSLLRPKVTGMQNLGMFAAVGGDADPFAETVADAVPAPEMARFEAGMATAKLTTREDAPQPVLVRKDFADLLKWSGSVQTDENGQARIPLTFPDNLTTWKARVWVLDQNTRVGEGSTEIVTSKELLVRLQAPRFLVEHDESVVSAVVHNDHDSAKTVEVSLEVEGDILKTIQGKTRSVKIAARSETRVDWRVRALKEGEATLRMRVNAGDDGDAVERKMPVRVHGMGRQDAWSRVIAPEAESASIEIEVPEKRRVDQTQLTIRFSPTVAGAVVDAIPYLARYPHGCTEQTLNRFVPAVIAQKMVRDLGVDLGEIRAKRTNLNPQELGGKDRSERWNQWQNNPVFNEIEMSKMVTAGIERLAAMRNSDGGWGWFSGYGEQSYPHTTAVVVHGLLIAKENGAAIPDDLLNAGIGWLVAYERKETTELQRFVENEAVRKDGGKVANPNRSEKPVADSLDAFVRLVLGEAKRDSDPMLAFLHRDRLKLPVYAQVLLGLEHHRKGDEARRDEVMATLSQWLIKDAENQTAYLDLKNQDYWWHWYGSDIEAHAWYLKLLSAVKPQDEETPGLVKYLVNNRQNATYWKSTRDSALVIEAIAGYLKASDEIAPEMEVDILLDGKSLRKVAINRENLFSFEGTVTLRGDEVAAGKHTIEFRRTGQGPVYANAYLEVFTLEDRLRAAGLEVKVERKAYKLIALEKENAFPDSTGLISQQTEERFRRELLEDGAKLTSGDRIEIELILESKNDYEYLLFSDVKAAAFEALDALSGYVSGAAFPVYMEPRDQTVDFFIRSLPRGTHSLRYQLRAEAPGTYKALPAEAEAMYAPELRANSEDMLLEIQD